MSLDKELQDYYNASTAYIDQMKEHPEAYFESYLGLIARYAPNAKNLLEIGCGSGISTHLISKKFPHLQVYGVDISVPAIEAANRTFRREGLVYCAQDAKKLGFEDGSFSIVCSFDCIEHIPDIQTALEVQMRVVKPGGVLVVKCPNHMSPLYTFLDILGLKHRYPFTKSWLGNFPRILFEINHLLLGFGGRVKFIPRVPDLTDKNQVGSDSDAVNDMSIIDLVNFLKNKKWKVLNTAWPRSNSLGGHTIAKVFPYLASVGVVAQKPS